MPKTETLSRRIFLSAATALSPAAALGDTETPGIRADQAFRVRLNAAQFERDQPNPEHRTNGDEDQYPARIGNFSKGLPHNDAGEVDPAAYEALLTALNSASPEAFEKIPMGSGDRSLQRKLVNPQAGMAFTLQGADTHALAIPPAPAFNSAEQAADILELYWQALSRDIPFSEYATNPITQAAADDLTRLTGFRGPRNSARVDAGTLFRGFTAGDTAGPYLSQFLVRAIPFGVQWIDQRMLTTMPGLDYMTDYAEWLSVQNGVTSKRDAQYDPARCYIRNGRDLAQWVHIDVLFQAYFNAMLILLQPANIADKETGGGMGAPLNAGNPYTNSRTQDAFGTFGAPAIAAAVCDIASHALKAVWYQKWQVHRRLRAEAYGGAIHNHLTGRREYPLPSELLASPALRMVFEKNNSYLLPQAFPEGSPLHPSYGAGHATVAGACVTILKALFDESYTIANPVMPSADGRTLVPYRGPDADRLTVGGELNKLAANVALGRNFGGIHYRSDYTQSLLLGESMAISVLRDQRMTYNESFDGFTFTRFDGARVTV
jgi:hypothetical protein